MAFSDGVIDEAELDMLRGVVALPDDEALRQWIERVLQTPLQLTSLARDLDTDDRRWTALRFAARMAWKDRDFAAEERVFLEQLASALSLPEIALHQVIREMAGPPSDRLSARMLRNTLAHLQWDAAQMAEGPVASGDLVPQVPKGAVPVARIGVDQAEVMGVYEEGVVARFLEGPKFLRWQDIIGSSRGVGLESSIRIHTEDGRIWSLIDARLGGIKLLFDRLYRSEASARSRKLPSIQQVGRRSWDDID
jgi:hypothetical protein